jgi:hypothetical protein
MGKHRTKAPPDEVWEAFARRYAGHPFLQLNPLYALTEPVIDALSEGVPGFFTGDQEWFERDLARATRQGFCLHRVIGGGDSLRARQSEPRLLFDSRPKRIHQPGFGERLRKRPGLTVGEFIDQVSWPIEESYGRLAPPLREDWLDVEKDGGVLHALRDLLGRLWRSSGHGDSVEIQAVQAQWDEEQKVRCARSEAYAGWLIANRQFTAELLELRQAWESEVERQGEFPLGPRMEDLASSRRQGASRAGFAETWHTFYRRWGLDRMLTWELPLPMTPSLENIELEGVWQVANAGVLLFVPWYLLRGGQFDLQQVARRIKFESAPEHLREWIAKRAPRGEDKKGDLTYQYLFWIYRCYELVLYRRYRSAFESRVEQVDRALGKVMRRGEDLVKKLRLRLKKALSLVSADGRTR